MINRERELVGGVEKERKGPARRRPVFAASAAAPAADKKAREFPEILSEGLIAIIIVEWAGVGGAQGAVGAPAEWRTISGIQRPSRKTSFTPPSKRRTGSRGRNRSEQRLELFPFRRNVFSPHNFYQYNTFFENSFLSAMILTPLSYFWKLD